MSDFKKYLEDLINLFYPKLCAACGNYLYRQEEFVCTHCLFHLPKTNYYLLPDNPVAQIFWGRISIKVAASYFEFHKGSKFQKLLHKMKYQNQKEIGWVLGKHFGLQLKESPLFQEIDQIIPVPLHPSRERKRGYNQAEWIAKGIAESMNVYLNSKNLYRSVNTSTQTRKNRLERWKNVENIFRLKNPDELINKHILLVDDVVTTGSTLEACAHALLQVDGVCVSIATLSHA
ncbi:MAG: ComF family protein [Marinifilaceae bacterium]